MGEQLLLGELNLDMFHPAPVQVWTTNAAGADPNFTNYPVGTYSVALFYQAVAAGPWLPVPSNLVAAHTVVTVSGHAPDHLNVDGNAVSWFTGMAVHHPPFHMEAAFVGDWQPPVIAGQPHIIRFRVYEHS